jgi:hypothetical protein
MLPELQRLLPAGRAMAGQVGPRNWRWLKSGHGHINVAAVNFDPYNLLAGLIFGTLGLGAFSYGKKLELWQPITLGLCLMIYPYLFSNPWLVWGIGVGLLVLLWFYHDE